MEEAVAEINRKLDGAGFGGTAKFTVPQEGSIVIEGSRARIADDEADVTIIADRDTFRGLLLGEIDPTEAFMTGTLTIEGDMGTAMQLASILK